MCMIGLPQNLILPSFMHKWECYLLSGIYHHVCMEAS